MNLGEARRLLKVRSNTTSEGINRAYRKRAFAVHPDRNPDDVQAHAKFTQLTEARDLALQNLGISHGTFFQAQPSWQPARATTSDPFAWSYTTPVDPSRRTVFDDLLDELRKNASENGAAEAFDDIFSVLGRVAKRAQDEGRADATGIGVLLGFGLLTSWLRRQR